MFIKPYKLSLAKRDNIWCTSSGPEKKIINLKKGKGSIESMPSRHELQKHKGSQ